MKREKEEKVRLEQEDQARKEKMEKLKKENDEKVIREKEERIRREKEELIRREKEDELKRLAVMKADEEARLLVRTQDLNSRRFVVTLPFLNLYIKYSLHMYCRELKRIEIEDMPRTRRMNDRGCSVKPPERLGVQAGTQVGASATDTLYRPFLTPLIDSLLLNNTDMDVDEDADDDDEDQGEVDPSPSKRGNTSYEEQKRRAAQWASDNLKGPSGKKEKAKVRSGCLRFTRLYVTLHHYNLSNLTLPYLIQAIFTTLHFTLRHLTLLHYASPRCCF